MGFRKDPAALKAKDKDKWILPAPDKRYLLHPEANHHTKQTEPLPSYTLSEPEYEVRVPRSERRYAPLPTPSYYGPHFEKGPAQEEIYNTRKTKELWRSEKQLDELPFREEYRSRAHSFHQPTQTHEYSDPYERRPRIWTNQMKAEYDEYKRFSEMKAPKAISVAHEVTVGRKHTPTPSQGETIKDGIYMARTARMDANRGVQARQGFIQKYPQSYDQVGISGHDASVAQHRRQADKFRITEAELQKKYETWDKRMDSYR